MDERVCYAKFEESGEAGFGEEIAHLRQGFGGWRWESEKRRRKRKGEVARTFWVE